MENPPRLSQVVLRFSIPFLVILFLISVACRSGGPDHMDSGLPLPTFPSTEEPTETPEPTDTPFPTVNPTKVAYVSGFAGSWDTNWGVMTCGVDGQMVNCSYTHDNGKIEATLGLDGTTMEGSWSESPSYEPPFDGGKVTFYLSEDGDTITGHWWYGQIDDGGAWTGTRQ